MCQIAGIVNRLRHCPLFVHDVLRYGILSEVLFGGFIQTAQSFVIYIYLHIGRICHKLFGLQIIRKSIWEIS